MHAFCSSSQPDSASPPAARIDAQAERDADVTYRGRFGAHLIFAGGDMTKIEMQRDSYDVGSSRWRHGRHTSSETLTTVRQRRGFDDGTRGSSATLQASGNSDSVTEPGEGAWPCRWT